MKYPYIIIIFVEKNAREANSPCPCWLPSAI